MEALGKLDVERKLSESVHCAEGLWGGREMQLQKVGSSSGGKLVPKD